MKNGIKYLIAGLVATGMMVSSSYAVITVNWGANNSSFVTDNTGAANYLQNALVEVGAFSSGPTIGSSSLANFTVFSSAHTGTGGNAGIWSGSTTASDVGFAHLQEYLVVFNAATQGAATQEAIVDVAFANNGQWRFPATSDSITAVTWDLNSLFASPGASANLAPGGQVVFGSVGFDPAGFSLVKTALVPEPSTYVLVGTGLLGLLGLRRRRS